LFQDSQTPKLAMTLSGQLYWLPTNLCEETVMFVLVSTKAPINKYWAHATFFVCFSALTEVTVILYQCQSCARWFPGARVVYSHQQTSCTRPRKCHKFGTTCWNER